MVIGIIGFGNMGAAIYNGIKENFEVEISKKGERNVEVSKLSDVIILAVKPNIVPIIAEEIKDSLKENAVIVSIAAGITLDKLEENFGKEKSIIRAMPNTPSMVNEGMTAISPNANISLEGINNVKSVFDSIGKCEIVDEKLMDAVTGISGSSPAYVFMFIEAMAAAANLEGMPIKQAYVFASQAVLGAAKMVLETGEHPAKLRDNVCSPGGTTIEAVKILEETGFRNSIMSAVKVVAQKSKKMGT